MKIAVTKMAIALAIICILLGTSLVGGVANYTSVIAIKDNTLTAQESTINALNTQIEEDNNAISSLTIQLENATSQIDTLTEQSDQLLYNTTTLNAKIIDLENQLASANASITELQNQVNYLKSTLDMSISRLQTLVFHVSEKGPGYTWGHLPNATQTYNQLLDLNKNRYNILLLPENNGHQNWAEELTWITDNFGGKNGIPIMLNVFGGGDTNIPTPMLSISDVLSAMSVANVRQLRISEVLSWHIDHPATPFPTAYLTSLLEFCRANNLRIFWTEWKNDALPDHAIFTAIQNFTKGFEDIVTVSFSTNSEELEPSEGFFLLNTMFRHWGGSVQAWYWETRYSTDLLNMPISTLTQHALLAKNMGAETIQLEPYWYFFDNGTPNDYLKLLMGMLT